MSERQEMPRRRDGTARPNARACACAAAVIFLFAVSLLLFLLPPRENQVQQDGGDGPGQPPEFARSTYEEYVWDLDCASNYTYNSSEVTVAGGVAWTTDDGRPNVTCDNPAAYVSGHAWGTFEETADKNGGEIYYQLSPDNGSTWWYWDLSVDRWKQVGESVEETALAGDDIAILHFSEGTGSITYDSFGNFDLSFASSPKQPSWTAGWGGVNDSNALEFDGNDYVYNSPSNYFGVPGFISARIEAGSFSGDQVIADREGFQLRVSDGHLQGRIEEHTWYTATSADQLPTGRWVSVAMQYLDEEVRVYVDGELEGTTSTAYGIPKLAHGDYLVVGGVRPGTDGFVGSIDEVWFREETFSDAGMLNVLVQRNTADEIADHVSSWDDDVKWRAFLYSNGAQNVSLDRIRLVGADDTPPDVLSFTRNVTSPVASQLVGFNVTAYDNEGYVDNVTLHYDYDAGGASNVHVWRDVTATRDGNSYTDDMSFPASSVTVTAYVSDNHSNTATESMFFYVTGDGAVDDSPDVFVVDDEVVLGEQATWQVTVSAVTNPVSWAWLHDPSDGQNHTLSTGVGSGLQVNYTLQSGFGTPGARYGTVWANSTTGNITAHVAVVTVADPGVGPAHSVRANDTYVGVGLDVLLSVDVDSVHYPVDSVWIHDGFTGTNVTLASGVNASSWSGTCVRSHPSEESGNFTLYSNDTYGNQQPGDPEEVTFVIFSDPPLLQVTANDTYTDILWAVELNVTSQRTLYDVTSVSVDDPRSGVTQLGSSEGSYLHVLPANNATGTFTFTANATDEHGNGQLFGIQITWYEYGVPPTVHPQFSDVIVEAGTQVNVTVIASESWYPVDQVWLHNPIDGQNHTLGYAPGEYQYQLTSAVPDSGTLFAYANDTRGNVGSAEQLLTWTQPQASNQSPSVQLQFNTIVASVGEACLMTATVVAGTNPVGAVTAYSPANGSAFQLGTGPGTYFWSFVSTVELQGTAWVHAVDNGSLSDNESRLLTWVIYPISPVLVHVPVNYTAGIGHPLVVSVTVHRAYYPVDAVWIEDPIAGTNVTLAVSPADGSTFTHSMTSDGVRTEVATAWVNDTVGNVQSIPMALSWVLLDSPPVADAGVDATDIEPGDAVYLFVVVEGEYRIDCVWLYDPTIGENATIACGVNSTSFGPVLYGFNWTGEDSLNFTIYANNTHGQVSETEFQITVGAGLAEEVRDVPLWIAVLIIFAAVVAFYWFFHDWAEEEPRKRYPGVGSAMLPGARKK